MVNYLYNIRYAVCFQNGERRNTVNAYFIRKMLLKNHRNYIYLHIHKLPPEKYKHCIEKLNNRTNGRNKKQCTQKYFKNLFVFNILVYYVNAVKSVGAMHFIYYTYVAYSFLMIIYIILYNLFAQLYGPHQHYINTYRWVFFLTLHTVYATALSCSQYGTWPHSLAWILHLTQCSTDHYSIH